MAKQYRFTFFLFIVFSGFGQDISKQEADSMLNALNSNKAGPERAALLLNISQYHIFKPGEAQIDFDSASFYLTVAAVITQSDKSSALYGYQLLTESYLAKEKGQTDEGKKKAEESVRILEKTDSAYYLGRAYYELSGYYKYYDTLEVKKRIALVELSIKAFHKAGDLQSKARSLEMLGDIYITTGDMVKRITILKEALATYDSIKYPRLQGVYVLLGESYEILGDHGQALFYSLKALRLAQMNNNTSMQMCQIKYTMAMLYHKISRCDTELKYLNESLEIARKNNDETTIGQLMAGISSAYYDLNQPDQSIKTLRSISREYLAIDNPTAKIFVALSYLKAHMKLKQYDLARPYCDTVIAIADNKKLFLEYQTSTSYRCVATYFFSTKQYQKSRYYLNKSNKIAQRINYEFDLIQGLQLSYKLDSAEGNFRSAFNHLNSYKTKMDSVNDEKKVRQLQIIGIEYEVGMKEDSIKLKDKDILLLTQRNSLQQANLNQASLIKNVTISGIFIAFVIIGLLYRQYRHKQKNNLIITHKNKELQHFLNEKEWLLKEIHHRVKNNLQIVMSLLNSQSAYINNESALAAIHDSQHRVHAMSLIHQKLYNTENLSSIDMSSYIHELVSYLSDSFVTGQRIRFEFDIHPLEMDVCQAVPLGLVLNEAITNAIKYAFPNDRSGVISITLSNTSIHHYLMIISDNGIGISPDFTGKKPGSLGMSLMEGLSEDLDGCFSIENSSGTTIKISFVHDLGAMRHKVLSESLVSYN